MSLIELAVIVFFTLGLIDKKKLSKILSYIKTDKDIQSRSVIGDDSLSEKWIWLEEE